MKRLNLKMLLITSLILCATSLTFKSNAQCNMNDWQALQALYISTNGAYWTTNTDWDQVDPVLNPTGPPAGCDLETMHGVNLDATGRVASVFLVNNNLVGSIPVEIGNLTNLTALSFSSNQVSGPIPSQIGNLTMLTQLILDFNQISGTIPPDLWTLTSLSSLSMRDNMLTGSIPSDIGNLINLNALTLASNQLSGDLPAELWTLVNIGGLNLSDNMFTGSISADIGNWTNLANLFLFDNQFTGPIPSGLGNLPLLNIIIRDNQFSGPLPPSFGNLSNLIQFSVANNQLTGCYDPVLTNLCNFSNSKVSNGNYFDAAWEDFCTYGTGVCVPTTCQSDPHVTVESADVYLDDACYGVILTAPDGMCYRVKVEVGGILSTELVACP